MCSQKNLDSSSGPSYDYLHHFGQFVTTHTTLDEEIGLSQLLATVGRGQEARGRKMF